MTAFDFSVMARSVRLHPFVPNMKLCGCGFKKSGDIPFAVGKPIRKFKAVIRLDAFDLYPFAGKDADDPSKKVCRRIGALFRIGSQNAIA